VAADEFFFVFSLPSPPKTNQGWLQMNFFSIFFFPTP